MIYHMSFGVREPGHVALVLAELTGATPVRAPSPPFPYGSWLVCSGGHSGVLLEILPRDFVFDPNLPLGLRRAEKPAGGGGCHVLVATPHSYETVRSVAEREGWPAHTVETGLFEIVKVWIEGDFLVEFLSSEQAPRYVQAFGCAGVAVLDAKLRQLEADMFEKLAGTFSAEALTRALGEDADGRTGRH